MTPAESFQRFGTIMLSRTLIRTCIKIESDALDFTAYPKMLPKDFVPVFMMNVQPKLFQRFAGEYIGSSEIIEMSRMVEDEMSRLITKPTVDEKVRRRDEVAVKAFSKPPLKQLMDAAESFQDFEMQIIGGNGMKGMTETEALMEALRTLAGDTDPNTMERASCSAMEALTLSSYMMGAAACGMKDDRLFAHIEQDHDNDVNRALQCVASKASQHKPIYTREISKTLIDVLLINGAMMKHVQDKPDAQAPRVIEEGIEVFNRDEAEYALRFTKAVLRQAMKAAEDLEAKVASERKNKEEKQARRHHKPDVHQFVDYGKGKL